MKIVVLKTWLGDWRRGFGESRPMGRLCQESSFSSLVEVGKRSFKTKNVPDEFKGEILLNLLGEKAENILVYVKDEEISDYDKLKSLVLREFEPPPLICLQNFRKAKRMPNETHVQLASRLLINWDQYYNCNDECGKIILSSAFGENVEAKLIKTTIALDNNFLNHPMDCLVAITDKLNAEALISPALYESLCSINDKNNKKENEIFAESADGSITFSNDEKETECRKDIFYVESDLDNINFNSDYTKIKDEQNNCGSLEKVRAELKLNKGNFSLIDGLIYHRDKILNEPVMQLVLSRCRIDKTCKGCQLRKPEKIGDRSPITPIVRPELPFEIVNIDVIGPIQPPSGRGHKYVLCMYNGSTYKTGIPSIIASDQGINFKSALTQEFTKRIGSSPRFSCPGYQASNGLVERWNKVLKDMIHHVIREDPRRWDRQLPFLLFAYREVPNTTTGISPFRLLYGREARGPLAILKSSWAGEIHLPTNISQSAADYLQEMKINMEKAAECASLTAAQKQKAYGEITSIKVKLPDGTVRHVYVNKIRKYHPQALAVGVIFVDDHEFGEIHPTSNLSRSTSERFLHETDLNHLKENVSNSFETPNTIHKALNSESVSDDFPLEDAVELIHSIGRANIITTLDLLKGYWAIPMAEDSKNLTSFKNHRQQYRFKVMSFENFHVPTSTTSQSSPKNWEEHLHLDTILTKLSDLNFTVNLKKCAFGKTQIKYLGHIIGSGKHESDPEKTAVINNLPVPKTKKELRSVLGLCNYYRFSGSTPSLYSPVPDKPYTIHSDASQIGIAACLSQKCDGKCYPIAYASQKLSKTQQSWSTIEREAFAIVWSLKKVEVWVFGTEIEFYTDHNPLPYLTKSAPQSARLQKWAFALQKFNVTIKHCPGGKMSHADALSRLV
ncbi:retrovirus-related Pol polyprotein from transposon opus [Trichonephila clavipes]|nr:retrovirus-related Pol polyprotein from transposon opus [Trichonephila clavipes]